MSLFNELKRRKVPYVAGVYLAIAWLTIEIAGFLLEQAGAPGWMLRLLAIVFIVGFPVAVALAWIIQRESGGVWSIDPSRGQGRAVAATVVLGLVATAGLSWLILPRIEDAPPLADYDPLPNSVAILPFNSADATPQERTIGETLFHALREGLNQSHELTQVRLKLDTVPKDPLTLGRRFQVAAMLTGRIERVSGGSRITLELLDIATGTLSWSHSFNWNPARIMELGTEAANGVLRAMAMPVLSRDRFTGTENAAAYNALLLGHQHMQNFNVAELRIAMEEFQRAIDLDHEYVHAYLGLAQAITAYLNMKGPPEQERQSLTNRQRELVDTAYRLDENHPDTLSQLGFLQSDNPELRILLYERALELDPDNAHTYFRLAKARFEEGHHEETERLVRKALEYRPQNANYRSDLAGVLWDLGRNDEAMAELQQAIKLAPDMTLNYQKLAAWNMFHYGRLDEAIINARKAYALDPEVGYYAAGLATNYRHLSMENEALAWADRAIELSPTTSWVWVLAAYVHRTFGQEERAIADYNRVLELDPGNGIALSQLGRIDIEGGRQDIVLDRWAEAYPGLVLADDPVVDRGNFRIAQFFASNLVQAGFEGRGLQLMNKCLDVAADLPQESDAAFWQFWIKFEIDPESYREELLAELQHQIVDMNQRAELPEFSDFEFDFIRDDPEFKELMRILEEDLSRQRSRLRKMDRNNELPPAPGVKLPEM